MNPEDSSLFVQSLATGLSVLDAFTTDRPSMNLREIAEAASVTKSAAQRFTHTLVTLGLLRKDATSKRFSLSARTLNTGYRYLQTHVLLERANPYLLELNRQTGETVNLAELDSGEMVYIGRFPSPHRAVVHMPVGRRLPISVHRRAARFSPACQTSRSSTSSLAVNGRISPRTPLPISIP
ncbi:helix-turn-helix domain-containing protein [Pseudomonas sp. MDMC_285]|nr:helix-turn-helix domain-containing protein [Pseudomonas sp. MDMC_285]